MAKVASVSAQLLATEAFCLDITARVWQRVTQARSLYAAELSIHQTIGYTATTRARVPESLEQDEHIELTLTVYDAKQRSAAITAADFSEEGIQRLIEKAVMLVSYAEPDPAAGLPEQKLAPKKLQDLQLFLPWRLPVAEAFNITQACEEQACVRSKKLRSEGASLQTTESMRFYANTAGVQLYYLKTAHSLSCQLVAESVKGTKERDGEYTVARDAADLLSIEVLADKAAEKALRRLNPRRIATQKVDVVFEAPVAKSLLQHFVQAASGPALYTGSSFLVNQEGTEIFPAFCTLSQKPHLPKALGSAPFDAEGVETQNRVYVENGKLASYFLGSYGARRLQLESTGNAGGVYNLQLNHSEKTLADLVREMGKGILVTELLGQGVDLLTGNYSRGAVGFWIEHGEIQYPIDAFTIAGNLRGMLRNIRAVSGDVDHRGSIHTGSIWVANMVVSGEG